MGKLLSFEESTGRTREVYEEIESAFGIVPNFFKAQAAVDPEWMEQNWDRAKRIMLSERGLDRKTKELLALVISLGNHCEYCSLAHEAAAQRAGATKDEINEAKEVLELFASFNAIADSLRIPCDILPQ